MTDGDKLVWSVDNYGKIIEKYWRFPDPAPKDKMIETFKQIRRDR